MSRRPPTYVIVFLWVPFLFLFNGYLLHHPEEYVLREKTVFKILHNETMNVSIGEEPTQNATDEEESELVPVVAERTLFHFCRNSQVFADHHQDANASSLSLQYQCKGDSYERFADQLLDFVQSESFLEHGNLSTAWKRSLDKDNCSAFVPLSDSGVVNTSHHHRLWGKREFPLANNITVLAIGNSHLRQVSKTMACQYAHKLADIHFLPAVGERATDNNNNNDHDHNNGNSVNIESFALEFSNGARWISITNQVLLYSRHWNDLVEEFFLEKVPRPNNNNDNNHPRLSMRIQDMDAIILGKFTRYDEAKGTNFETTMKDEEEAYYEFRQRQRSANLEEQGGDSTRNHHHHHRRTKAKERIPRNKDSIRGTQARGPTKHSNQTRTVDDGQFKPHEMNATDQVVVSFERIPPPDITEFANLYDGPLISLSMFSKKDKDRVRSSYNDYREQCLILNRPENHGKNSTPVNGTTLVDQSHDATHMNTNLYTIDSRRYIEEMGIECSSDDKRTIGTCHEPSEDNEAIRNQERYRDPSDMHRCAGTRGGHADLVSWDVIEALYSLVSADRTF